MPQSLRVPFAAVIVAVLVGGPWWYASYRHRTYRNFRVVEDGVLYRSGQLTPEGLRRVIHDYGIKTVISLREGQEENDRVAEEFLKTSPAKFVRLPHKGWAHDDESRPNTAALDQFRRIVGDPANHPVLIHCFAGIHRTGAYCAIFRMDRQGWANERAIREMVDLGYDILDDHKDLQDFLRKYRPPLGEARPAAAEVPAAHLTPVRVHGGIGP